MHPKLIKIQKIGYELYHEGESQNEKTLLNKTNSSRRRVNYSNIQSSSQATIIKQKARNDSI